MKLYIFIFSILYPSTFFFFTFLHLFLLLFICLYMSTFLYLLISFYFFLLFHLWQYFDPINLVNELSEPLLPNTTSCLICNICCTNLPNIYQI